MFLCYDGLVERRQKIILGAYQLACMLQSSCTLKTHFLFRFLAKAKKSTAIVSSLFPKVRVFVSHLIRARESSNVKKSASN